MINCQIFELARVRAEDGENFQVRLGVLVVDTDPPPGGLLTCSVDIGNGASPVVVDPIQGPLVAPTTISYTRVGNVVKLTFTPTPQSGTYSVYIASTQTAGVPWNTLAANLQALVQAMLDPDHSVSVGGSYLGEGFELTFSHAADAIAFSAGSAVLYSPIDLGWFRYAPGAYRIRATASNYRSPVADVARAAISLDISNSAVASLTGLDGPAVFGPVGPSLAGWPNAEQWSFNIGQDLGVLQSSVQQILLTEPGERVNLPDFGCAIRQFLYEGLDAITGGDIQDEVRRAVETWEPRVSVASVRVARDEAGRKFDVFVDCVSRLNRQAFVANASIANRAS